MSSASDHLPVEFVSSALTFLSRPQLLQLLTVSYRMRDTIAEDFTGRPYLFLRELDNYQYWRINCVTSRLERFIELLAQNKFARFNITDLSFASLHNEAHYLKEIGHVCQGGKLCIKICDAMMQQQAFMPLISACNSLYIFGYNTIQWIPHCLSSDNLQRVWISENDYGFLIDISGVCLDAIMEFLFKPTNNHFLREIYIRNTISNQQIIIKAIEKAIVLYSKCSLNFSLETDTNYALYTM